MFSRGWGGRQWPRNGLGKEQVSFCHATYKACGVCSCRYICVEVSDLGDDGNGTRCVFVSASRFGYGSLVGGKRVGLQ